VVENIQLNLGRLRDADTVIVPSELELLNKIVDMVIDLDPDILVGWEIQSSSWGYLRARFRSYGTLFVGVRAMCLWLAN
jgi:DNA polymerase zeta